MTLINWQIEYLYEKPEVFVSIVAMMIAIYIT